MEASRPLEENLTVLRKACPASTPVNVLFGVTAANSLKFLAAYLIRHAIADDQQHLLFGDYPSRRLVT